MVLMMTHMLRIHAHACSTCKEYALFCSATDFKIIVIGYSKLLFHVS
jgi:hypothetical protein